jgi:Protein of unknown function (DUF3592)
MAASFASLDTGLMFALVVWVAICVPGARELWRSVRWRRVAAKVVGHEIRKGDPNDGSLKIDFMLPDNRATISTTLWNDGAKFPFPHCWPVGSTVVVAYNPASPSTVTWPRSNAIIVVIVCMMLGPLFAWVWYAL